MTAVNRCLRCIGPGRHIQPSLTQEIFMNKQQLLTLALGSAFAAVASLPAQAVSNPFAAKSLDTGYQVAQADMKGDMKSKEASCGADKKMDKKKDGGCGADKKADMKSDGKAKDGKCGEAKCGADKKK